MKQKKVFLNTEARHTDEGVHMEAVDEAEFEEISQTGLGQSEQDKANDFFDPDYDIVNRDENFIEVLRETGQLKSRATGALTPNQGDLDHGGKNLEQSQTSPGPIVVDVHGAPCDPCNDQLRSVV